MGSDSYPNLGRFLDPDPNIDYLDPEDHNSCFTFLHTNFMGLRRTVLRYLVPVPINSGDLLRFKNFVVKQFEQFKNQVCFLVVCCLPYSFVSE